MATLSVTKFENALLDDDKFTRLSIMRDFEKENSIVEIQQWLNTETNEQILLVDHGENGADLFKNEPENNVQATLEHVGVDTE